MFFNGTNKNNNKRIQKIGHFSNKLEKVDFQLKPNALNCISIEIYLSNFYVFIYQKNKKCLFISLRENVLFFRYLFIYLFTGNPCNVSYFSLCSQNSMQCIMCLLKMQEYFFNGKFLKNSKTYNRNLMHYIQFQMYRVKFDMLRQIQME